MSSQKSYKDLGLPELTSFKKADELTQEWTVTQGQLLNKTFVITDFREIEAYDEPALLATSYVGEKEEKVLINSMVLMKQLRRVSNRLPVEVTIRKVKQYYTFT